LRQVLVNLIINSVEAMSTVVKTSEGLAAKNCRTRVKACAHHSGRLRDGNRSEKYKSNLRSILYDKV
jgi:hypothetical protein